MRYSKGIMWVDDCRIPFVDEGDIPNDMDKTHLDGRNFYTQVYNGFMYNQNTQGRFTPNLLVCDDMLNDGSVGKSNDHKWIGEDTSDIYGKYNNRTRNQVYNDKGTNSRYYDLDKWFEIMLENL
jgi:hypothetical protein